jgi:hypothetical protein
MRSLLNGIPLRSSNAFSFFNALVREVIVLNNNSLNCFWQRVLHCVLHFIELQLQRTIAKKKHVSTRQP